MPRPTLEQRMESLESQFQQLKDELCGASGTQPTGWRHAVDKYADDVDLQSVLSNAQKLREADRRRGRNRRTPKAGKQP